MFHRIVGITDLSGIPENIENFSICVTGVEQKRYALELKADIEDRENRKYSAVFLYQGEKQFNSGDKAFIHKKIYRYNKNATAPSAERYWQQGIPYLAVISDDDMTIIEQVKPGAAAGIKRCFSSRVDSLFNSNTAALVKALYTGNQNYISKEVIIKYRNAGVVHVLSASGLHVAIVAGFPAFLLFFGFSRRSILTISMLCITAYLFMTDMPVSLVRAAVMFFFFYCQMLLFRKTNVLNNLFLAASFIIILWPWELFSPGFQLSFGATLGIILFYNMYRKSMKGLPEYIKNSAALTVAAQVLSLPLLIYHFNQVNTISLLSNFIIIPLTSLFIYSSFITLVLSIFSHTSAIFGAKITLYIYQAMYIVADKISGLNMNFHVEDISSALILLYMLSLLPLVPLSRVLKLRYYPVIISFFAITLYLKTDYSESIKDKTITSGNSEIILSGEPDNKVTLDIKDYKDTEILLNQVYSLNIPVKKIILLNDTNPNLSACRRLNSELIIDECCFIMLPCINNSFKNLIHALERDRVKITFNND